MRDAERFEFGKMVAEAARLRRAAARAGNVVPARRQIDAGNAGPRIDVEDSAATQDRHIEGAAARRWQREIGQRPSGQMPCCAGKSTRHDCGMQNAKYVSKEYLRMPNLLEQAISSDDGDRAARIIQDAPEARFVISLPAVLQFLNNRRR
jgi:hypothetical protein